MKFRPQKKQVQGVYFRNILFMFFLLVLDGQNSRELPFAVDNLEYNHVKELSTVCLILVK